MSASPNPSHPDNTNLDRLHSDPVAAARAGAESRLWMRAHRNLAVQNRRLDAIYREVAP